MDLRIVEARVDAADQVTGLLVAQFQEHAIDLDEPRILAGVRGLLGQPSAGFVLLAEDAARPVGLACVSFIWTLEHGGRSAWLDELYVVPDLRGGGIGTRLVRAACDHAERCGSAAMDLEVDVDHERAARLYEREGFRAHRRARWVKRLAP